jgi:Rap1a immunity proteins
MSRSKFDPRRSLVALDQHKCLIAVVELSLSTWLVGGIVPGIARDPLKKLTALLTRCTDTGPVEVERIGYVEGIADAMAAIQAHDGSPQGSRACIPDPVLSTQVRDIVTRFLREHSELRHFSAGSLVAHALAEAFPCPPAAQP